jgi:hypothetical protein
MSSFRALGQSLRDSSPTLALSPPISLCVYAASMSHVHHLSTARSRRGDEPKILQDVVHPMMHCGAGHSTRCLSSKKLRLSGHSGMEVWLRAHCYCSLQSCTPTTEQLAPNNSQQSGRSDHTSSRQKPERRRSASKVSLICYRSHFPSPLGLKLPSPARSASPQVAWMSLGDG